MTTPGSDPGKKPGLREEGSGAGDTQQRLAYDRTHLANERTFGAWIRTGLSVAAIGIATSHFLPPAVREPLFALTLGTIFVIVGVAIIGFGAWRYSQISRDLRVAGSPHALVRPWVVYLLAMVLGGLLFALLYMV
ncbi:MAG: YidH family protein [Gemmatimonadales bacterium]